MEPMSPSVCRSASKKTARRFNAVVIARAQQSGWLFGVMRHFAFLAVIASFMMQAVKVTPRRSAALCSRQRLTR